MSRSQRRQYLQLALGAAVGVTLAGSAPQFASKENTLNWRERTLIGFGTSLWLRAAHANPDRAEAGLDAAVCSIRHVERQMSLFDQNSALNLLNRQAYLQNPDPHLLRILQLSLQIAKQSDGAFDVTMQPLWLEWAAAKREDRLPSLVALSKARERVGWQAVRLGKDSISFAREGMSVSLNGIAQGYAADLARQSLQAYGIEHALIDTGEWSPLGRSPLGLDWSLALEAPRPANVPHAAVLVSDGRAIATSSDVHTSFSSDHRHHHIIDPRTGYSPVQWASVTVVAPTCALADGLTKVMFMADAVQALKLARYWGVDILLIDKSERWYASPGMPLQYESRVV